MRKALYALLFLVLYATNAQASHLAGGELRYEYNGTNYTVILTLYGDCTGISMPATVVLNVASPSQSVNSNVNLIQVSNGIATASCGFGNRCTNTSSTIPGYRVARYETTVNTPNVAASDWLFSVNMSARNSSTNFSTGGNMYLEAKLDNSNGHNSSPYIPNTPSFYISNNANTSTIVPLQTLDPDGDSIVYERIIPMKAPNTNMTYAPGFSATMPFGANGTYAINAANQTLELKGTMVGFFGMAFRVKEYRNGTLIGTFIRDFGISVLASTLNTVQTYPMINPTSFTRVYTCPSSIDSAVVWFTDPVVTDSVTITIDTPALAGWSFNNYIINGRPTAYASVTWTAPSNLNPQTLPYFFINLKVMDDGCPRATAEYAILVKTRQCSADSVWPGDANSDNVVNLLDPLAVALTYNSTGPQRPNANNNWVAQYAPDWSNNIPFTSVNRKHADCNGDGTVNLTDLAPIVANYGLTHPKGGSANKTTGSPEIFFDLSSAPLLAGTNVSVPIKMGTTGNQMKDIYGFAARIKVTTSVPISQVAINTTTSWFGNTANTLQFSKDISTTVVDWAYARIDHQNATGDGTIAMVDFTIPNTAVGGETVVFSFENPILIDKEGKPITLYNMLDTTGIIQVQQSVASVQGAVSQVYVVPNPSGNTANLNLQLEAKDELAISVVDVTGKVIWTESHNAAKGNNQIVLPAAQIANGIYFIHVQAATGSSHKAKWIKR